MSILFEIYFFSDASPLSQFQSTILNNNHNHHRPGIYQYSIGSNGLKFRPGNIADIDDDRDIKTSHLSSSSLEANKTPQSSLIAAESTNVVHKFQFEFKHGPSSPSPMMLKKATTILPTTRATIVTRSINDDDSSNDKNNNNSGSSSSVLTYRTHHRYNNQPSAATVDEIVEIDTPDDLDPLQSTGLDVDHLTAIDDKTQPKNNNQTIDNDNANNGNSNVYTTIMNNGEENNDQLHYHNHRMRSTIMNNNDNLYRRQPLMLTNNGDDENNGHPMFYKFNNNHTIQVY